MLRTAGNLWHALHAGWRLVAGSWSVWLLLALANLFFIWMQQQLLHPALARLLPRIPAPDTELIPAESYLVLAMEGGHELFASPLFHRLLLALGLVALLKWLLQPFLHIFVFSPLAQPEPTVSYYLLWRQLSHRFPAFLAVAGIQCFCCSLWLATIGGLGWHLAEDVWSSGGWNALVFLLLLLLCGTLLLSWGFSYFTLWQAALAKGDRLWPGAVRSFRATVRHRPGRSVALPIGFWLLSTALAATIQTLLPSTPELGVLLGAVFLPVAFLWLTYTLSAGSLADRQP